MFMKYDAENVTKNTVCDSKELQKTQLSDLLLEHSADI